MSHLVQVTKRGQTPIIELEIEPHEYVVNVELRESMFDDTDRKTIDWKWTAFVATPLGTRE